MNAIELVEEFRVHEEEETDLLQEVVNQPHKMSESNSNTPLENRITFNKVVPLSLVSRLKWNSEFGEKLKVLRLEKKTSRRGLAEKAKCSHQFIQDLETGVPESIAADFFLSLCESLEIEPRQLIPVSDIAIEWQ